MVRTLESDIDFARCEISNALCDLESLGLSLINGEFFEFELGSNFDDALRADILAKLYNNAHAIYYKILVYISKCNIEEQVKNLVNTPPENLSSALETIIAEIQQKYDEGRKLKVVDILDKIDIPMPNMVNLRNLVDEVSYCISEAVERLGGAIGIIESAKEKINDK